MREHKYRGKRSDNGEWVYGYYYHGVLTDDPLCVGDCRNRHVIMLDGTFYHVIPETVGQYTGLKDNFGFNRKEKEIYTGDIVKCTTEWNFGTSAMTGVIVYDEKDCAYRVEGYLAMETNKDKHSFLMKDCWSFEVKGNVHDNPELVDV